MKISWKGDSTIQLKEKKSTAILNPSPHEDLSGYSLVIYDRTQDSLSPHDDQMTIDWPGEYDVAEFAFKGLECQQGKQPITAYVFSGQHGNIAWMGEMQEYPDKEFIERLGDIHVLIVPVGDGDVMNAKNAFKLVEALEPMVVIPICHGGKREGLQKFFKEMDVKPPEPQKDYEFKRSDLSGDNLELVLLES